MEDFNPSVEQQNNLELAGALELASKLLPT